MNGERSLAVTAATVQTIALRRLLGFGCVSSHYAVIHSFSAFFLVRVQLFLLTFNDSWDRTWFRAAAWYALTSLMAATNLHNPDDYVAQPR